MVKAHIAIALRHGNIHTGHLLAGGHRTGPLAESCGGKALGAAPIRSTVGGDCGPDG